MAMHTQIRAEKVPKWILDRIRVVLSSILIMFGGAIAHAQMNSGMSDPAFSLITQADREQITATLGLTRKQQEHVRSIIEHYEQQLDIQRARIKEMESAIHEIANSSDPGASPGNATSLRIAEKQSKILDMSDAIRVLQSQMHEEVRAQLDEAQTKQWNALLRDLRRERTLRVSAKYSGEPVDMVAVMEDLLGEREPAPEISDLISNYVIKLDAVLIARNAAKVEDERTIYKRRVAQMQGEFIWPLELRQKELESLKPGESGSAVIARYRANARTWLDEEIRRKRPLRALHRQVRSCHLEFIDQLRQEVGSDLADRVYDKYLERAYPDIFGPNEVDRWFEEIESLELSRKQSTDLQALQTDYYDLFRSPLDQTLKELRDREEDAWEDERRNKGVDNSILEQRAETLRQKRELLATVVELADTMLTPSQREEVGRPTIR